MGSHRPFVRLRLVFVLLAVVAAAGLAVSAVAQAAPTPVQGGASTPSDPNNLGATTLSGIQLNGVTTTVLTVAGGADVKIFANWSDHNTGCPGCIHYLDVAFQGSASAAGCIENGGFDSEGDTSGSGTVDLGAAPTAPGIYPVRAEYEEVFNCGNGWTSGGGTSVALIVVAPPDPDNLGGATLSGIALNGVAGTQLVVNPGADVQIGANYADHNTGCPGCVDFVDVAFQGSGSAAGCIDNGSVDGFSGSGTVDLGNAPTTPGVYNISAEFEEQFNCGDGWDGNSPGAVIAQIIVPSPPTAAISTPADNQTYTLGQVVPTSFSCSEGLFGPGLLAVGGCTDNNGGSGTSGHLNTSSAGANQAYTVTATSQDTETGTATIHYTVSKASTSLKAVPQLVFLKPFVGIGELVVQATLTSGGSPLAGQTIAFSDGSTALCSAVTNSKGVARCMISWQNELLLIRTNHYTATFAGSTNYTASSSTVPVITFFW